jgi:hypothetical protein
MDGPMGLGTGPTGLGVGPTGLGCTKREVGVRIGVADPPGICTWYIWTGVESPGLMRCTLAGCSGVRDRSLLLLPLALLRTEGVYSLSEYPPSASLSIILDKSLWAGGEWSGWTWTIGEGEQCSGVDILDPPQLLPSPAYCVRACRCVLIV